MNYYKQGDAAKAEQIKAAFRKLGINTLYYNFKCSAMIYFSWNGKVNSIGVDTDFFKTRPDYKELELPVEHNFKFKVGDWIVQNNNCTVSQITKVINDTNEYGEYHDYEHTNGYFAACFENQYHLWTIRDAKDGDVLVTDFFIFLFKKVDSGNGVHYYCHCGVHGEEFDIALPDSLMGRVGNTFVNYRPATKEQRIILFKKMQKAGYQWDADKKELSKIQPHYDISNFKPFDKVLVRDADDRKWRCNWFSHYSGDGGVYRFVTTKCGYAQCIPFEGNEHLLGTTDMCPEEYINW